MNDGLIRRQIALLCLLIPLSTPQTGRANDNSPALQGRKEPQGQQQHEPQKQADSVVALAALDQAPDPDPASGNDRKVETSSERTITPLTPADQIKKLQERIDELEKRTSPSDKKAIEQAVQDALKAELEKQKNKAEEEEERKKAEEEAKKKAEEDEGTEVGKFLAMTASWKNGLQFVSPDNAFRYHVGGRVQLDMGGYSVPAAIQDSLAHPLEQGADFRRLRLRMDGGWEEFIDFMLEVDFSTASDLRATKEDPSPNLFLTDVWIAMHDIPVLDTIRIGHQKEYMTFANATSSRFLPFLERPYIFDAFEDDFQFGDGVTVQQAWFDQHMTTWAGFFKTETRTGGFDTGTGYAVDGRITALPIYNEEANQWVNFSASGTFRAIDSAGEKVTVRPLFRQGTSFLIPNLLSAGNFFSRDGLEVFGGGVHSAWGPVTLGGEWLAQHQANSYQGGLPNPNGSLPPGVASVGNLFFSGFYVEALCFLTPGDFRPINRVTPGYDRITPRENFFLTHSCSGLGAWEIGVRYDYVSLNSGPIQGGTLSSVSTVLNWYWNSQSKVQLVYIYTQRDLGTKPGSGEFSSAGVRFAFDF